MVDGRDKARGEMDSFSMETLMIMQSRSLFYLPQYQLWELHFLPPIFYLSSSNSNATSSIHLISTRGMTYDVVKNVFKEYDSEMVDGNCDKARGEMDPFSTDTKDLKPQQRVPPNGEFPLRRSKGCKVCLGSNC